MNTQRLIALIGLMVCAFSAVAQTAVTPPPGSAPDPALESCLQQAVASALKAQPRPTADAVMNSCSLQWAATQKYLKPEFYNFSRDHARTAIAQKLASATSQP